MRTRVSWPETLRESQCAFPDGRVKLYRVGYPPAGCGRVGYEAGAVTVSDGVDLRYLLPEALQQSSIRCDGEGAYHAVGREHARLSIRGHDGQAVSRYLNQSRPFDE